MNGAPRRDFEILVNEIDLPSQKGLSLAEQSTLSQDLPDLDWELHQNTSLSVTDVAVYIRILLSDLVYDTFHTICLAKYVASIRLFSYIISIYRRVIMVHHLQTWHRAFLSAYDFLSTPFLYFQKPLILSTKNLITKVLL